MCEFFPTLSSTVTTTRVSVGSWSSSPSVRLVFGRVCANSPALSEIFPSKRRLKRRRRRLRKKMTPRGIEISTLAVQSFGIRRLLLMRFSVLFCLWAPSGSQCAPSTRLFCLEEERRQNFSISRRGLAGRLKCLWKRFQRKCHANKAKQFFR